MEEDSGIWEVLKYDNDFEINTAFPYPVRRIGTDKIKKEYVDFYGYATININGKIYKKHRLIANQWINNDSPDTKNKVDHIDRNKLNNHISNLRWTTNKENCQNKNPTVYQNPEYLNELPSDAELIEEYNECEFDRYYYDIWNEIIILKTKYGRIKIIKPYIEGKRLRITLYDINDRTRRFSYSKLIEYLRNCY